MRHPEFRGAGGFTPCTPKFGTSHPHAKLAVPVSIRLFFAAQVTWELAPIAAWLT